jgi:hypothetical protein
LAATQPGRLRSAARKNVRSITDIVTSAKWREFPLYYGRIGSSSPHRLTNFALLPNLLRVHPDTGSQRYPSARTPVTESDARYRCTNTVGPVAIRMIAPMVILLTSATSW